jgi:hypothetical protein
VHQQERFEETKVWETWGRIYYNIFVADIGLMTHKHSDWCA